MVVIAQLGIEYEDSCIRRNIKYVLTFITGQMSPSLYIAIYVRFPPVCNPKYQWVWLSILLIISWTTMSLSVCVRLHWQSMSHILYSDPIWELCRSRRISLWILGQELLRLYLAQLVVCVHNELVKLLLAMTTRVHASESRIWNLRI